MKRYRLVSAAALAIALGLTAAAAPAAPGGPMHATGVAAGGPELMKRLEQDSQAAQAKIAADPAAAKAMAAAVHAKRSAEVKSLLLKAGFPAADLERAKLSLVDKGGQGGDAQKIKITITVRCCPAEVIITIEF